MKKLYTIIIAVLCILSLTACTNITQESTPEASVSSTPESEQTPEHLKILIPCSLISLDAELPLNTYAYDVEDMAYSWRLAKSSGNYVILTSSCSKKSLEDIVSAFKAGDPDYLAATAPIELSGEDYTIIKTVANSRIKYTLFGNLIDGNLLILTCSGSEDTGAYYLEWNAILNSLYDADILKTKVERRIVFEC